MNFSAILIIVCCLALIIGAVMVIFQSSKKFNLSEEQLKDIKKRELEQLQKDNDLKQ